jgi:hypothetical protein
MKDDRNHILDKKWWEMQEQGHQVASALTKRKNYTREIPVHGSLFFGLSRAYV